MKVNGVTFDLSTVVIGFNTKLSRSLSPSKMSWVYLNPPSITNTKRVTTDRVKSVRTDSEVVYTTNEFLTKRTQVNQVKRVLLCLCVCVSMRRVESIDSMLNPTYLTCWSRGWVTLVWRDTVWSQITGPFVSVVPSHSTRTGYIYQPRPSL